MTAHVPSWLQAEYPFTPRTWQTPRGAAMSYLDEGPRESSAVVMVHGNPTWSFYYRHVVKALAPHRRCIVPDHVGMGLSSKPQDYPYTLDARVDDLNALIEFLGLSSIDLLVHDWGGAIGLGAAARRPAAVRRIGILNTAAFALNRIPARIALCKLPALGPLLVRGFNGFAWPATWMTMHRRRLTALEKRAYLFPYDSWADRVAVSGFVQDIPLAQGHPSWSTLKSIESALPQFSDRPVEILWGGRDFCFNDAFLTKWREVYPRAAVTRLGDAGHYVLEDARDDVVPRLARFFA